MLSTTTCKIVTVGDGAVGKTCLLMVYVNNEFPTEYVPTIFDNYDTNLKLQDKLIKLSLWDTAGQEEYDKLRYLSYPNTDVFLVAFSVMSKTSFLNVEQKWLKELQEETRKKRLNIILVGTKIDLRENPDEIDKARSQNEDIVTKEMGEKLAQKIGAIDYVETSAFKQIGITELFEKAIHIKLGNKKFLKDKISNSVHNFGKKNKNCSIL